MKFLPLTFPFLLASKKTFLFVFLNLEACLLGYLLVYFPISYDHIAKQYDLFCNLITFCAISCFASSKNQRINIFIALYVVYILKQTYIPSFLFQFMSPYLHTYINTVLEDFFSFYSQIWPRMASDLLDLWVWEVI